MARAIWSGAVSFGLVNVPVKAYAAVRDHSLHFNQLERGTGARIHYKKVSDKTGDEVATGEIESGYEVAPGRYVVVEPDEMDAVRPRTSRTIDIADFVDLKDIDPIYYERTYWLAPDGEAAERPWRLLTSAMEAEGKAGIGTVVMRNKQYLGAIRPLDGALALSTMRFADEVVPQADVDALPGRGSEPEAKELRLATQIIDSLATEWDPERYHDTYTEELRELIDAKAKGEEVVAEEEAPGTPKVIDLMQALEASLAAARKGGGRSLATEVAKVAEQLADDAAADGGGDDAGGRSGGSGRKEAASAGNRPAKAGRSSAKAGRSSAKAGRSSAKATGGEATGRNAAGHKAAGRKAAGQKAAGRKAADSGSPSAPSGRSGAAGKKSA